MAPIIERGLSKEVPEEAPAPAGAPASIAPLHELLQPLLAEEAPPTPAGDRAGLSKALAIIRWAWMGGWVDTVQRVLQVWPAGAMLVRLDDWRSTSHMLSWWSC